LNHYPFVV